MPCGMRVQMVSPDPLSLQTTLNASDLNFTTTSRPAGVTPSDCSTVPEIRDVGCSRRSTRTVFPPGGSVPDAETGSGLKSPTALTVNGPAHTPSNVNCPVVKSVSTILKFAILLRETPTRPP